MAFDRNAVKSKIKKLMAKGHDKSLHFAEAQAFLAKAQQLMLEFAVHEFELDAVNTDPTHETEYGMKLIRKGKMREVHHKLICASLRYFNVRVITYRLPHKAYETYLFGTEQACEFAAYAHDYLLHVYPRLWGQFQRAYGAKPNQQRSFYFGVHAGFVTTLEKEQKAFIEKHLALPEGQLDPETNLGSDMARALISIDKALQVKFEKAHPDVEEARLTFADGNKPQFAQDAFGEGVERGKEIKVNRPLEAAKDDTRIS